MIANLPQLYINTEGAKISLPPYTEAAGCPSALHGTSSALQGLSLEGRTLPWRWYWATRQEESGVVGPGDGRSCCSSLADLCCVLVACSAERGGSECSERSLPCPLQGDQPPPMEKHFSFSSAGSCAWRLVCFGMFQGSVKCF